MRNPRFDRVNITPEDESYHTLFVIVDDDGDLYLQDGGGDDATSILIRKSEIKKVLRAIKMATEAAA